MADGEMIPLLDTLQRVENGALAHDATDALREVVSACTRAAKDHGKAKGRLTLTLDVEVEGGVVTVRGGVATKTPKAPRARHLFYATSAGDLTTQDPKQHALALEAPTREIVDIKSRSAAAGA